MAKILRIIGCAGLIGTFLVVAAGATQSAAIGVAPAANVRVGGPRLGGSTVQYDSNWAGYAANSSTVDGFTTVTASWVQPALTCTSQTSYAAFWAGLDGNTDNTVEQTGVLGECVGGVASYLPWYELYPQEAIEYFPSSDTVAKGDHMTATVTETASETFAMTLADATEGWQSVTKTQTVTRSVAKQESAEAIVEAPSSGNQILPLANFGTAYFTGVTYNSPAVPIGNASNLDQISIESNRGQPEASTSSLGADNESFSVAYVTPAAPTPPSPPSHRYR